MNTKELTPKLARASKYIFFGLLAYIPLHIFLSTWVGTSLNILPFAKVAKDIVLVGGFLASVIASARQPWFKPLLKDKLVWLILGFAGLNLLLAAIRPTDQDAEILGVVYNTRFLLFFLYAVLLTKLFPELDLKRRAVKIVLSVGTLVLFLGILQYTVLPDDALARFGYERSNGVLPAFFIDDKPDLERAMSTLRDPNSFGSYIIIIGTIALAYFVRSTNPQVSRISAWLLVLSLLGLWHSFSRSAWLGFTLAAFFVIGFSLDRLRFISKKARYYLITGLAVALVVGAAGLYLARDSYFVQNVVFHADETTVLEDPNQLRLRFWQESVDGIAAEPLGRGPGTAGLTSIHNDVQGTVLTENYYLQIAHETGVIGLALFLGILAIVGVRLFALRSNTLALGLFAAFIGLALTNFLVHIWANEAVAYTWWGLAGLIIAAPSAQRPKKAHNN